MDDKRRAEGILQICVIDQGWTVTSGDSCLSLNIPPVTADVTAIARFAILTARLTRFVIAVKLCCIFKVSLQM